MGTDRERTTVSVSFYPLFLITFIVIKVGGTALASWSWWWVLFPFVPVIVFVLNASGVKW